MKAHIVYRTKPRDKDIEEVKSLMPMLEVTIGKLPRKELCVTHDELYDIYRLDWEWLNTLFDEAVDVRCLCLDEGDLNDIGVKQHWGFYSLDFDSKHQFYMTNLDTLDPRAKKNGFKSSFAWMFVHEYLHGAVWETSRDLNTAAALVHEWEAQGVLKERLQEHVARYNGLKKQVGLLSGIVNLLKKMTKIYPFPQWPKPNQPYGIKNSAWYPTTGHHIGTDFPTPIGTPIKAHEDCVVIDAGNFPKGIGNWCQVQYPGYTLVFCHLQEKPQLATRLKGEVIGYTGASGFVTGPHCHVEGWWGKMDRTKLKKEWRTLTFDVMTKI